MDTDLGVVRDREAIRALLIESCATRRQLAVCFNGQASLIVRICQVTDVLTPENTVIFTSRTEEGEEILRITLDAIQSVYPIREFSDEASERDWAPEEA